MFIDWWAKEQGQSVREFGVSPIVVVSWQMSLIRALADTVAAKIPKHWFYGERHPLYTGQVEGRNVSFAYLPVGAPGNRHDYGGDDCLGSPSFHRSRIRRKPTRKSPGRINHHTNLLHDRGRHLKALSGQNQWNRPSTKARQNTPRILRGGWSETLTRPTLDHGCTLSGNT